MASETHFEEFYSQNGDIECYLERLAQYFIANDIKAEQLPSRSEPQ